MSKAKPSAVRFPNGETYAYDASLWRRAIEAKECEVLTGDAGRVAIQDYKRKKLLEIIEPGTRLRVINTGGMSYRVFVACVDSATPLPYIREITADVATLCGMRRNKSGDIVMGGYGYSKTFEIGYCLGRCLWPNGTPKPHGKRNGEPDNCGGYAITVD